MAKTSAERSREYRERKRREAAEKAAAADAPRDAAPAAVGLIDVTKAPRTMRDAVDAALAHMKWIKDSDGASVAQAKILAEDVDVFRHIGDHQKELSAHGRLSRVLNDLGGTPSVRMLRELRSSRAPHETEGGDGNNEPTAVPAPGGNVSQFKRPPRRRA